MLLGWFALVKCCVRSFYDERMNARGELGAEPPSNNPTDAQIRELARGEMRAGGGERRGENFCWLRDLFAMALASGCCFMIGFSV